MKLRLSIAMSANPRTWPILDGRIEADGIEWVPSTVSPSELFWRQLRFGDFDVSEMSVSSLMMVLAKGNRDWLGLPIFTTHRFFHTWILVRRDAGIATPADLRGKRVGVPEYQQTAALWARGVLQHEFGVQPREMEFWMERLPSHSHAHAAQFTPPPGVTIKQIPAEKNIGAMMLAGELDATLLYIRSHGDDLVDRSTADLASHPAIAPLFPDVVAEGVRYFRKTGIFPINHGMVIRRALWEQHPWAALNIYKAFEEANAIAERERAAQTEYHILTGALPAEAERALRLPVLRHGIAANRKTLETAAQYSHEQGLTPRLMPLDEIFAANVMEQ
ncbi:MAG TPA: PhnD/SsuA/transferrin family substrate-binding protein [Stellaceae bacterium]|nr:PhnD/SsuA/transferrin family substrate-binding protein [Stellaceae bacterium]